MVCQILQGDIFTLDESQTSMLMNEEDLDVDQMFESCDSLSTLTSRGDPELTIDKSKDNNSADEIIESKLNIESNEISCKNDEEKVESDDCIEIIVNRVRAVTIKAPIKIGGQYLFAVIDTGAEVTVMSDRVFQSLSEEQRSTLTDSKRSLVVAEEGRKMSTQGIAEVAIELGPVKCVWPVYVAPISDDILLGCDIIDNYDITINTRRGIQVQGCWVECDVTRKSDKVARILLNETSTIPGNTEVILQGHCENAEVLDTRFGSIEPITEDERNIMVARCLVDPYKKIVPVRLVNLGNSTIKLRKNYMIGEVHSVESFENLTQSCPEPESTKKDSPVTADIWKVSKVPEGGNDIPNIPESWKVYRSSDECDDNGSHGLLADIPKLPDHLVELYDKNASKIGDHELKKQFAEILIANQDAFARHKGDLGTCNVIKHSIDTAGAIPVRQPLRPTPKGFEDEEEKYLKEQLKSGVIQPSKSSWASPVVLVRKKDQSVRWCIDYRKLNACTIRDAYNIPRIDMCLDSLSSATLFSIMDLQMGYWQIECEEKDRYKTAFVTKYGLFEYRKMPMGISNGSSTFQRCMELVFRGMQWKTLLIYLDDIILYSSNLRDHLNTLEEVLSRLKSAGLKLKPSKCQFFEEQVLYLGHVVGKDGIRPNPSVTESIREWQKPKNVKDVQKFLGLCNYYRQFICKFSEVAAPLSKLTQKNINFIWSEECDTSFQKLKAALCNAPILAYPKPTGDYILDTDASNIGIGGVLSQIQDGKEVVISYGSKKLDKQQQRYSVTRRELLAVVTFIHQFRHYLLGKKFHLRTDHGSLRWLFAFKDPQGQVARWLEFLSEYNFEIQHRAGNKHQNADFLSRIDENLEPCNHRTDDDQKQCKLCQKQTDEWKSFKTNVDDVGKLGKTESIRAVTRSQTQTLVRSNWLNEYTAKQISEFQREDTDLGPIHKWLDENKTPSREEIVACSPAIRKYWLGINHIYRENDILYQKKLLPVNDDANSQDVQYQLMVPKILRKDILKNCHNNMLSAHMGVSKTSEKVKRNFYWYCMDQDIKQHVKQCEVCNRFKGLAKKPKAALQSYTVGSPIDRIGIDVIGPLPKTKRGNRFLLVIGDHFTRWMEVYPLPDQQADKVAEKFVGEFISRFGVPLEVHTDQGRNFESSLFREVCKLLEVHKTRSTSYRPSSNGLIEKFNYNLEKMIRTFVNSNMNNWDNFIGLLLAAYRSTVHPATGFTPNMMMFGREVILPNQIIYPLPDQKHNKNPEDYVGELRAKLENIYKVARENLKEYATRQKKDYDTRISENRYTLGQLVYRFNDVPKKLEKRWLGPFIITELLGPVLYQLKGKNSVYVVHHDKLKPYTSEEVPAWMKPMQQMYH